MVYALLAERAEADDRAELTLSPHVNEKHVQDVARNRAELDVLLYQPIGKQAAGDAALLRELGGVA